MTHEEIEETIHAFGTAAKRASKAGADGLQLHAAHGYLINQFLSPFYNHRDDIWGGSIENRFRLLREIIKEVKKNISAEMILLVKLNSHDYTPQEGITPALAFSYAKNLADIGVDGIEVSCGNSALAPWNICRGDVPLKEILNMIPEPKRFKVKETLEKIKDDFQIKEGYNLEAAMMIRPVVGNTSLFAVGGWRQVQAMENAITQKQTDLISMCRPFIREPNLVKKQRKEK
jgi:2,4-dienoyl-CoA reductase-like NADH-dependent reductase (Old Yellow Enzyme family)